MGGGGGGGGSKKCSIGASKQTSSEVLLVFVFQCLKKMKFGIFFFILIFCTLGS